MQKLGEVALLMGLSISFLNPKVRNRTIAEEGAEKHGVKRIDALSATKHLLAREALAKIQRCRSMARQYHYHVTLPWSRGWGLLPSMRYFEYCDVQRKYKEEFLTARKELIDNYADYVERDKIELGDLFDPYDYPPKDRLVDLFDFRVRSLPVPDKGHFLVDINSEALEELKQNTEETIRLQLQEAQKVPWQRLIESVGKMVERLSNPDSVFRDSLLENVASVCNVLPSFTTITGDQELEAIRKEVETKLLQASADVLRDNKKVRRDVAKEAEEIMKKMEAYTGPIT